MSMKPISVLRRLKRSDRGRIIISNISDGLDRTSFSIDYVAKVLKMWGTFHSQRAKVDNLGRRAGMPDEFIRSIELFHGKPPTWWRGISCSDIELQDNKPKGSRSYQELGASRAKRELSDIMSAASARRMQGKLIFPRSSSAYIDDQYTIKAIRTTSRQDRTFRMRRTASLPMFGRILWSTRQNELETLSKKSLSADEVRDKLGLIHYPVGFDAVAIFFDEKEAKAQTARPTFADAAAHRRFMARPTKATNRRVPDWGWTADLQAIADGLTPFDGLRERVVSKINASESPELRLVFLPIGRVTTVRGKSTCDNDKKFAKLLLRGRSPTEIAEILASKGV